MTPTQLTVTQTQELYGITGALISWFHSYLTDTGVEDDSLTSGLTSGPNQRSPFFADGSKLYRPIDRPIASSSYLLQSDLDCQHKWSHDWAMEFNITTCKVLHISR